MLTIFLPSLMSSVALSEQDNLAVTSLIARLQMKSRYFQLLLIISPLS